MSKQNAVASSIVTDLQQEFKAMKECGMRVPKKALTYIADPDNLQDLQDYRDNGMRISEIADLVIQIA